MRAVRVCAIAALLCVAAVAVECAPLAHRRPLRFRHDGTFKIAQFADLHYGEGEDVAWGREQDANSTRVMRRVIEDERPDLVVFSGDQVTGNNIHSNATSYWAQVVAVCVETNTPWATVFGNHDDLADGTGGTRKDLLAFDASFPLSYTQAGPSDLPGLGNYVLHVEGRHSGHEGGFDLFMLDSGGGSIPEIVSAAQVQWYVNETEALAASRGPGKHWPSVAFFHIPSVEYVDAFPGAGCGGVANESVTPQDADYGLLSALVNGNVTATFVGHDHGNDWCCPFKTVHICYGRHTGYGGYGEWIHGARIVHLTEGSNAVDTWVRLEDGSVIERLRLAPGQAALAV